MCEGASSYRAHPLALERFSAVESDNAGFDRRATNPELEELPEIGRAKNRFVAFVDARQPAGLSVLPVLPASHSRWPRMSMSTHQYMGILRCLAPRVSSGNQLAR